MDNRQREQIDQEIQHWSEFYGVAFSAEAGEALATMIVKAIENQPPCPGCNVIRGEDARRFLEQMETAKDRPIKPCPVPNIEKAKELARKLFKDKNSAIRPEVMADLERDIAEHGELWKELAKR